MYVCCQAMHASRLDNHTVVYILCAERACVCSVEGSKQHTCTYVYTRRSAPISSSLRASLPVSKAKHDDEVHVAELALLLGNHIVELLHSL
jgi:hypothetical protein